MKAASMDPFGFVQQVITKLPKAKPKLRVVESVQSSEMRMDLTDERQEELKRGVNRFADYLANKNLKDQEKFNAAKNPNQKNKAVRAYQKVRDFESANMLRGLHLKYAI
jgi:hypothetical protein